MRFPHLNTILFGFVLMERVTKTYIFPQKPPVLLDLTTGLGNG